MKTVNIDILLDADIVATALSVEEKTKEIFLDMVEAQIFGERFIISREAAKYNMTNYVVNKSIEVLVTLGLLEDKRTISSTFLTQND